MPFPRSTGILLHPISFPSRGGIGDFGPAAYEFLNWLLMRARAFGKCCRWGRRRMGTLPILLLLLSREIRCSSAWSDLQTVDGSIVRVLPASLIKWGQLIITTCVQRNCRFWRKQREIFCSMPRGMHDFASMRSAPKIPGGWTILSSTILCAIAMARNVGTNGRANSHGVSPLL